MMEACLEHTMVAVANTIDPFFKSHLQPHQWIRTVLRKMSRFLLVSAEEVLGHSWHYSSRKQVRREHSEAYGFGQRDEQVASHTGQKEHGDEDDADRERGNERRNGNLRSAVENGLLHFFSLGDVAVDVLNFDGCIVNENADSEREPAQGHDVDGLAQRA